MTAISIRPITDETGKQHYRASAGETHSTGQTPGEALDAIVAQTGQTGQEFFLLTPNFQPDGLWSVVDHRFFTAQQQQRLATLMQEWRNALDRAQLFPEDLKLELDALEAELLDLQLARTMHLAIQIIIPHAAPSKGFRTGDHGVCHKYSNFTNRF
jgi:hypothetical protein